MSREFSILFSRYWKNIQSDIANKYIAKYFRFL